MNLIRAIDLFAGPGGWDVGAAELGIKPLGVEWDDAACATRQAAGLRTVQADVSKLDPVTFAMEHGFLPLTDGTNWEASALPPGPIDLLIASPPCQAWSAAGKRDGLKDVALVYQLTAGLFGGDVYPAEWYAERVVDERSLLVTEPLRWALELRPSMIALEQVPPVLDYWRHVARLLSGEGYDVWTGILEAERYGVPQTRERAILMAKQGGGVGPPRPTHQRYVPGEPARHDVTFDGEVLPWISMAEALGWEPGGTIRTGAQSQTAAGLVPYERSTDAPAPVVDPKARSTWKVTGIRMPGGGDYGTFREIDKPAPPVAPGKGPNDVRWVFERPATTVACDPRIPAPGHKREASSPNAPGRMEGAVRVTADEAAVLQSFGRGYPWQGSRTKVFQQIGNAVPPILGRAILAALTEGHR